MQPHVFPFVPDPNQRKSHHARKETAEQLDVSLPGDSMLLAGLRSGGGGCCATMGRSSREEHADLCLPLMNERSSPAGRTQVSGPTRYSSRTI